MTLLYRAVPVTRWEGKKKMERHRENGVVGTAADGARPRMFESVGQSLGRRKVFAWPRAISSRNRNKYLVIAKRKN